jgi:hypothetical protein
MAVEIWPHVHLVSTVRAQGNIKTIIVDPPHRNDPIEVVKVSIAGKDAVRSAPTGDDLRWWPGGGYMPGHEARVAYRLPADDKWIEGLSFVLRNRTAEKIARVGIALQSPESAWTWEREFSFGQFPPSIAYFADGKPIPPTGEPITFKPCEEVTFRLADDQIGLSQLRAGAPPAISQVYPRLRVYLEDGLVWMAYFYEGPDPEHPGQRVPTSGPYFPPNGLPGPHLRRPKHYQPPCDFSASSETGGELTP